MGMTDGGGVFFLLCLPLRPNELDLRRPLVISELGVVGFERKTNMLAECNASQSWTTTQLSALDSLLD